ncbi:MAG: Ig-like domain-containing protein [Bacteroidales bacterium]|jgi:hypothetical protein|nr:Ig-like domain-containing protein [Bacteroidales bacterium]
MKKFIMVFVVTLSLVLIFWSCSDDDGSTEPINNSPKINSLTFSSDSIPINSSITIVCNASDQDGDFLSYSWSATGGTFSANENTSEWFAPEVPGDYSISCIVSDSDNSDSESILVTVVELDNYPPTIISLSAATDSIAVNSSTTITCNATDQENDSLNYSWSTTGGTFSANASTAEWIAPSIPGNYDVTCSVSDTYNTDTETITVTAIVVDNFPPTIISLSAVSDSIVVNSSTTINCNATDQENDSLSYSWNATGGTFSANENTAEWFAPSNPGNYNVNCIVSDGKNNDSETITIKVVDISNYPPTINSLIALSDSIAVNSSTAIICNATDQDGDSLSYSWSATGGSISGYGSTINWFAPEFEGDYNITCTANDGKEIDSESIFIHAIGTSPICTITSPLNNSTFTLGEDITVKVDANDIDGTIEIVKFYLNNIEIGSDISSPYELTFQTDSLSSDTNTIEVIAIDNHGYSNSATINFNLIFTYIKTFASGTGNSIQQTTDGGYIIIGTTSTYGAGGSDIWMIKTDKTGNEQWSNTFGGTSNEYGNSVQQTSDGGYIITGETSSYGAGLNDLWLIKTDQYGNKQWDKTFGTTQGDSGNSVCQTNDEGFIIVGSKSVLVSSSWSRDFWLIKTDNSGNMIWEQAFGESNHDYGRSVKQTDDGGYILVGSLYNHSGYGDYDITLIKTDDVGNLMWSKSFGTDNEHDYGSSVQQTTDGGFIVIGYDYNENIWLIRLDSNLNQVWDKKFATGSSFGYSVQQTTDNGFVITGKTYSAASGSTETWLIKTDSNGNEQWDKIFFLGTSNESGNSVQQTSDNGYVITGFTGGDLLLIKTDSYGNTK